MQVSLKSFFKYQCYKLKRRMQHHHLRPIRVGWVTANTLKGKSFEQLGHLGSVPDMRISNTGLWINDNDPNIWNEIYDPKQQYHVVIFVKAMDARCQLEVKKIQAYGGKVVFDANVNYYEIWGTYDIPGTCPTLQQQRDAIWMTQHANWVVADSTYLLHIIQKHTSQASWIPDNVDLQVFKGARRHTDHSPIRLIWSGVSKKAQPLLSIQDILGQLKNTELILVSEDRPPVMHPLQNALPCHYVPYSNQRYAQTLQTCDIIISPKNLINGYEMGHTEYKITLGMAMGLPAVASPQQSYCEAISYKGGGIIANTPQEWLFALTSLCQDPQKRNQMGKAAQQTVEEHYATPIIAQQYHTLIQDLL